MEQIQNTHVDETMEALQQQNIKDRDIAEKFLGPVLDLYKAELDGDNEFLLKHAFLSAAKLVTYLAQAICKDQEDFSSEILKAQDISVNKVMKSILPKIENGRIVEEGYDLEDLSLRRLMMTFGTSIDYAIWRADLAQYQENRNKTEQEMSNETREVE